MVFPVYFDEIQQWYVVFFPREKPRHRWFHWLLKDEFVHCLLVRELPAGHTLVIDANFWGVAVQIVETPLEEFLLSQAERATAILGFTADYRRQVAYGFRGLYTCVTLTKSILGLWKCALVQSPFGLYKLLLKYPTITVVKPYVPYIK